ncbi:hypothetical protein Thein_0110 [Thermodesulfatator indicus DSM 15286]|uniref:Uncharacterized protein n=1 Tax=Thermodesulfatator indicus (strain DSM 15286 / JCM 11887 / CIR29812) TaxID=667014 RepID=F8A8U8_THEID|nr:hypothetical protein [Thermodesulfatator indicus]AEH43995.1 hypothetical protein Thein_0110 [Thermodesulfatator indicus DSM 15286]
MATLRNLWASLFLVLFLFGLANGAGVEYYRDLSYTYQVYRTDSTYTNIQGSDLLAQGTSSYKNTPGIPQHWWAFVGTDVGNNYGYGIIFFEPNDENHLLLKTWIDFKPVDYNTTVNADFPKHYRQSDPTHQYELPAGAKCQATYISHNYNDATKTLSVTIQNNLNPLQTISGIPIKYNGVELHKASYLPPALAETLKKNYYTKYFAYLKLTSTTGSPYKDLYILPQELQKDSSGKLKTYSYPNNLYPNPTTLKSELDDSDTLSNGDYLYYNGREYPSWYNSNPLYYYYSFIGALSSANKIDTSNYNIPSIGAMEAYPYMTLKPGQNTLTFNLTPIYNTLQKAGIFGTWTATLYLIPIDGKCDLNENNQLNTNDAITTTHALTYQLNAINIIPDTTNIGTELVDTHAMHRFRHCRWNTLSHELELSDHTTIPLPTITPKITLIEKINGITITKKTIPINPVF